jgi:hypothetical protein
VTGALRNRGARLRQLRSGDDDGITLVEVMVAMVVMTVFMAMFTVSMQQMYRSTNKTESLSTAQSQIGVAFLRLDKEIRYAAGISTPGTVGADWYVEYLTAEGSSTLCTQLRLTGASRLLQRRTWTQGPSPLMPTGWTVLASEVTATQPFTYLAPDASFNFQRLQLKLVASAGSGATATSKQTDVTFTALNTSLTTSSPTVCAEGRAVP